MKKYVWLPLILMAVFGSAAVSTRAQTTSSIRANVPFDFIVGEKALPAGTINVQRISATDLGLLSVTNPNKSQHAIRMGHSVSSSNSPAQCKLVFHRYGNRYYLSQVWTPGYGAVEFSKSRSERALERETMLSRNSTPEVVTVMADME
jgi:hypothetical protein